MNAWVSTVRRSTARPDLGQSLANSPAAVTDVPLSRSILISQKTTCGCKSKPARSGHLEHIYARLRWPTADGGAKGHASAIDSMHLAVLAFHRELRAVGCVQICRY